jgi:hypothetical protein
LATLGSPAAGSLTSLISGFNKLILIMAHFSAFLVESPTATPKAGAIYLK